MLLHTVICFLKLLLHWTAQLETPRNFTIALTLWLLISTVKRSFITPPLLFPLFSRIHTREGATDELHVHQCIWEKLSESQCSFPGVSEWSLIEGLIDAPFRRHYAQFMPYTTQRLACSSSQTWESSPPILRGFSPRTREAMPDEIIGCRGAKLLGEIFCLLQIKVVTPLGFSQQFEAQRPLSDKILFCRGLLALQLLLLYQVDVSWLAGRVVKHED